MAGRSYYEPSPHGFEEEIGRRMQRRPAEEDDRDRLADVICRRDDRTAIAAVIVAALSGILGVVVLVLALVSLTKTLTTIRMSVEEMRRETLPVIDELQRTVTQANADLERLDALLDSATSVTHHRRLGVAARLPGVLEPGHQGDRVRHRHRPGPPAVPPGARAMFRRLFWLVIGAGFGFGVSFWFMRFVRETVDRYRPERVSADLAGAISKFGADLRAAVAEGREAMRERRSRAPRLEPQRHAHAGSAGHPNGRR